MPLPKSVEDLENLVVATQDGVDYTAKEIKDIAEEAMKSGAKPDAKITALIEMAGKNLAMAMMSDDELTEAISYMMDELQRRNENKFLH